MATPLYTLDLLRLTTEVANWPRLAEPMASVEQRAQPCGSHITIDLVLDGGGRVTAIGMSVAACAFGQAAAVVLARSAAGGSAADLAKAATEVAAWLSGEGAMPCWPGLEALVPAVPHNARHNAIRLPFEAAASAARAALERRAA